MRGMVVFFGAGLKQKVALALPVARLQRPHAIRMGSIPTEILAPWSRAWGHPDDQVIYLGKITRLLRCILQALDVLPAAGVGSFPLTLGRLAYDLPEVPRPDGRHHAGGCKGDDRPRAIDRVAVSALWGDPRPHYL